MISKFDNMIMRLFVLRIGNKKEDRIYRLAYGAFRPCLEKMAEPKVSDSSATICNCEYGKVVFRKVVWATDRDTILGIFDDLVKGISLKTSFEKWGACTDNLDFDVVYNQDAVDKSWSIENIVERQLTYTKTVSMLEPDKLFEKDGEQPTGVAEVRKAVETELAKATRLPFGTNFDHLGNLDVIIEPDRKADGKQLVECTWKKTKPFVQEVKVMHELADGVDEVIVNVRFGGDERVMSDNVAHYTPDGTDRTIPFVIKEAPMSIETKVWLKKDAECQLVHQSLQYILHSIHFSMSAVGGKLKVTSEWMQKIRNNLPPKIQVEADKAETIEHKSTEQFTIGSPIPKRKKLKISLKTNDEFFPIGWDKETKTQGMLSFIDWFRKKADRAVSIFLQDPYFEDVALLLIASANNQECEYTVLTQTQLKTNPDGTINTHERNREEDGGRKKKIVNGIKANPRMFEPMKMIVKDLHITHNILHDRYLIFDYGDNRMEAYMLSNSLQGATAKQPLLVTQIGDSAFEKVKEHIDNTLGREGIETIYDYQEKKNDEEKVESKEIADQGFFDWLVHEREGMKAGNVEHLLLDIKTWKTREKLATMGYFLATINPNGENLILENLAVAMQKDSSWTKILSDFILRQHYSDYPIGYINCPRCGYIHGNCTELLSMGYHEIVTPFKAHLLDYMSCEGHTFRVYGQYYAAKLLLKLSVDETIRVLKLLRPTLLGIETDKTIHPVYKVTLMLMTEIMETAVWKREEAMKALMSDTESCCRGVGGLMFLYRAVDDSFKCDDYRGYLNDDDEIVTLCHAAWGMKPEPANKEVFYGWLVDVFKKVNDADYFKGQFIKVIGGCHAAEDKAEYISKVVMPLIKTGLVDKDDLSRLIIDRFYDQAISGQYRWTIKGGMSESLFALDGDIHLLYDKAKATLEKYQRDLKAVIVHDDEIVFEISCDCIELRGLLLKIIKRYEGKENDVISQILGILAEVDKTLDGAGMEEVKRRFEDIV